MYDLIGDIHGHAQPLMALLDKLGYRQQDGVYQHLERKVIFLGDFVDRGPQIREVLEIVRPMVQTGAALAVMGNHELNTLAFHLPHPDRPGEYVRQHTPKNEKQCQQTLQQLSDSQLADALDWFRTLPLWLDLEGVRAVHACWDRVEIDHLQEAFARESQLTDRLIQAACLPDGELFHPVEVVLKGKEMVLPEGIQFADKDGNVRTKTRMRWYLSPEGHTYGSYAMTDPITCDLPLPASIAERARPYEATEKPVFVGHYWLKKDTPQLLGSNVACLDYSVAKGGFLCAYRWNGEQVLGDTNFVVAT
ncbi:metallophosphoesterase [Bremerella sp. JC817]|uniref:metallophosphoesterase n=1 Tax=Bremerella sp. JC817 TaxID=3231756 RepID=UPI00345747FA